MTTDCDHAESRRFVFCSRPSTRTDSIKTTGGSGLVLRFSGFAEAGPLMVGSHRLPSGARHAAGCEPPEHSRVGRPSALPYVRQEMEFAVPSAKSSSDFFEIRISPALEP